HLLMFRFDTVSRSVSTAPLDPHIYLTLSHLTPAMCLTNSQVPLVTGAMRIRSRCTLHFTSAIAPINTIRDRPANRRYRDS
ncbi:hypothetical protein HYDPIDRAFT_119960, partial [Hydnomerulius pinastri MD-312]